MTEPNRYGATVEEGTLYLVGDDDRLEIGPMDGAVELMGGETYTLEYTDEQASAAWLATDDGNTKTLDVRDSLVNWGYTPEFVGNVEGAPLDETGENGYPQRLEVFVDLVTAIWDAKGHLEE